MKALALKFDRLGFLIIISAGIALFSVSSQSLWIDEANSAVKAVQPTWGSFVQAMRSERGSDLQMPLYMGALWGWDKMAGSSEYALRAMNIPLFIAAIATALWGLSTPVGIRAWFCLFAVCSPMVWTYLDEARPYILQFFCSTLVMVGLVNLGSEQGRPGLRQAALVFAGIVLLCGSSLLGVIYSFFFGLAFLAIWLGRESFPASLRRPGLWILVLPAAVVLAGLATYYFWTLQVGARASGVGKTNAMSMAFCAYELLGFTGAGPGRAALRENPIGALRPFIFPIALYGGILAVFLVASLKYLRAFFSRAAILPGIPIRSDTPKPASALLLEGRPPCRPWIETDRTEPVPPNASRLAPRFLTLAVLASAVTVIGLGVAADFRVIGRHLMPLLPFLLLGMAGLASVLWSGGGRRGIVAAVLLAGLFSCISLRLSPRFAKDDYRSAAAVVRSAVSVGSTVWWAADMAGANYYGVFPAENSVKTDGWKSSMRRITRDPDSQPASAIFIMNATPEELASLPKPDVIILSKADIYDGAGALREWMEINGFCISKFFPAFTVWKLGSKKISTAHSK